MERRTLLTAGSLALATGALAACSQDSAASEPGTQSSNGPASNAASSKAPTSSSAPAGAIELSSIPVGGGVVIEAQEVVVAQPSEGTVTAFTAVCPHQGCLVNQVKENKIVCPCHQSVFSALDGSVQSGPSPQGLAPASVRVENGNVILG